MPAYIFRVAGSVEQALSNECAHQSARTPGFADEAPADLLDREWTEPLPIYAYAIKH